jgi:hypothetical protein
MEKKRHGWLRPVLAIGVLAALTGALLASPVSADFEPAHEKKHVKKIAKKAAKKFATSIVSTTVGPTLFIEETELLRYGPINMTEGQADQTIGTFGPFTLKTRCNEDPAGTLNGRIIITTTEDHSAFESDDDSYDDFSSGIEANWASETDGFPDTSQEINDEDDEDAHAISETGATAISAAGSIILLNPEDATPDCIFAGGVLTNAPAA